MFDYSIISFHSSLRAVLCSNLFESINFVILPQGGIRFVLRFIFLNWRSMYYLSGLFALIILAVVAKISKHMTTFEVHDAELEKQRSSKNK